MKVTLLPARALAPELVAQWSRLQEADPALESPFLRPEFTLAVAGAREDVRVAILEQDGECAGFFPFQRSRFGAGRPVGDWMNDLQGVVARSDVAWDAVELLRGCDLVEWQFPRLLASQTAFAPFHLRRHVSAYMDLSRGFDAYAAERKQAGTRILAKIDAHKRKLERAAGPLRFEAHSRDERALAALMQWKLERYGEHGYEDVFAIGWSRQVVEAIHATQGHAFGGMLSVLYAGDEPVAALMGIRSRTLWHGWLPAYNPKFARYSPGLILLGEMARHAPTAGLERIELGGPEAYAYKQRLMSGSIALAEGTVTRLPLVGAARRSRQSVESWVRRSPTLHPIARTAHRILRKIRASVA
jgi:CelD/BcsL family acetyltransferase involved in cellulose biosynthesis